ncbi:hypothetical protein CNMCM5793_000250 [Aspergillus hiratsukae]|uniref:Uncharacterized protein n=1 Tax=Aspergillus hiratsukae TaxID=1194566 RepID=A0A8H6UDC3_9EURO|nr:hypothetical protein CNMCM5793_000250 [Aspergillus hiratsukae]KAH1641365.1 hypothetical protein KXX59_000982 [Aspergillus fumigatus]KAH1988968.1 hypothetical protein KXV33_000519 [Aspergillus fumigatus]
MAPREYPLTAAYAKFVNAGLIEHIGQGGKPASLPAGVQNATQDLTKNQNDRIKKHLENEVNRILEGQSAVLDMGPKYKGTSEDAKKFLQEILELAEKANIDNAHAALEKVNSFSPAALETEDIEVSDAPQPGISEPAAPVGAAAAQVKETKPEEESREDEAPGAASPEEEIPEEEIPEEEIPEEESPQEESPQEESPEEEAPGVASPELQPRSGVRTYGKGRRFPAGETAEAFETENIPWTKGDPHDWPWWTYPLPNGGAIMAEKKTQRTDRRRSAPISYYLVEIPVQQEKDGAAVTLYQHKLVRYSDYPTEIDEWKRISEETGQERCVFTATDPAGMRDGKNYTFLRLEFVAPLTRLSKNGDSPSSLTSEAECVIYAQGYDKPVFLVTSQFKRARGVGDKKGKLLISRVCARDGQLIPARTEAKRIWYTNRACPDNAEELELLDDSRASTALPHGQQEQQGIDEDALFGRVQTYVDRRFADFSTELSAAVASSIADEMAKLTINVGSMIEAQIQTHMSRGGNRETPSSTNADLRYNTARREAIGRTPQSAATTPRIRERTLPPGFLPSPPRATPLHQSIEA